MNAQTSMHYVRWDNLGKETIQHRAAILCNDHMDTLREAQAEGMVTIESEYSHLADVEADCQFCQEEQYKRDLLKGIAQDVFEEPVEERQWNVLHNGLVVYRANSYELAFQLYDEVHKREGYGTFAITDPDGNLVVLQIHNQIGVQ